MSTEAHLMEKITPENTITLYSNEEISSTTTDNEVHTAKNNGCNILETLPPDLPAELEMEVENSALTRMKPNTGTSSKRQKTTKEEENVTMATTEFRESFTMETSSLKEDNEGLDLYERVKVLADVVKKGLHDFQHNVDQADLTPINVNETHVHEPPVLDNEKGVVNDTPLEAEKSPEDIERMEKLRKAIAKMRRLDSKLADVMKKEREVKRKRDSSQDHTPLQDDIFNDNIFKTQPIEGSHSHELQVECIEEKSESSTTEIENESDSGKTKSSNTSQQSKENNFIERNKKLAGEKGEVLMTEEEKKRLEELLMEDEEEGETGEEEGVELIERNNTKGIEGYRFTDEEALKLEEIDRALEQVPSLSISKAPSVLSHITDSGRGPGEGVLASLQVTRSEQQRLKEIDYLLASLKEIDEGETPDNDDVMQISLSSEQLDMLLQQYRIESET